jgi:McrBC 5-methylcytosine restriction system component
MAKPKKDNQKFKEIREFDSITFVEGLDDKYKVVPKEAFEQIKVFAEEYTGNNNSADPMDFMRIYRSKDREAGELITFQNYVGLIQLKCGYQIQILPKIDLADDTGDSSEKTKKIFLKMLRCLRNYPGKISSSADLNVSRMNLYEVFISMYIDEVRKLVKRGLKSAYVLQEDNLRYYKGKLKVGRQIKHNAAHKERFYVEYEDYLLDRPENKLIKSTLLKLLNNTMSNQNSKDIRQLLISFEMVHSSDNYVSDFSKVSIDRTTKDYDIIMQWTKTFLSDRSFTTFSGSTVSRSLLFPMELIFQDYVAKQVKKCFEPDGWDVNPQDKKYFLFRDDIEEKNIFRLKPDIVLRNDNTKDRYVVIMDTKWKRLVPDSRVNYGISQGDMYQMYAYSMRYMQEEKPVDYPEVWLLYPKTAEMNVSLEKIGKNTLDFNSNGVKVHAFFVDVENIEDSLEALKKEICRKMFKKAGEDIKPEESKKKVRENLMNKEIINLSELNRRHIMDNKLVIYDSAELYKREVIEANHNGIPVANCDGMNLISLAGKLLKDYKIEKGEAFIEADKALLLGIMMSTVFELIREGKLHYFKETMIDGGTVSQLLKDIDILRVENKLDVIKDSKDLKLANLYMIAESYGSKINDIYDDAKIFSEASGLAVAGSISCEYDVIAIYKDAYDKLSDSEKNFWKNYVKEKEFFIIDSDSESSKGKAPKQFFKVFGLHNEIHAVVKDVLRKKIPWEQVQIVTADPAGYYPMVTYLKQLDIPYCLPEGLSEEYSFEASLVKNVIDNPAYFDIDSEGNINAKEMYTALADNLKKLAGNGKFPSNTVTVLFSKASVCSHNAEYSDYKANYHILSRMIKGILLGGSIVDDKQKEEGAVYIASLTRTETAFRPYVYLIGFESRNYPGGSTQSPVLLDKEKSDVGLPDWYLSDYHQKDLEKHLDRIMSADVKQITISYVSFDTVNMREQNPSAFYKKELTESGEAERCFDFGEKTTDDIVEAREWILQTKNDQE